MWRNAKNDPPKDDNWVIVVIDGKVNILPCYYGFDGNWFEYDNPDIVNPAYWRSFPKLTNKSLPPLTIPGE